MAIIGIDLGTSNSAATVLRGGRPVIIPSAEGISLGGKTFPSYVAIAADGETLIGEPPGCRQSRGHRHREINASSRPVNLMGKTLHRTTSVDKMLRTNNRFAIPFKYA